MWETVKKILNFIGKKSVEKRHFLMFTSKFSLNKANFDTSLQTDLFFSSSLRYLVWAQPIKTYHLWACAHQRALHRKQLRNAFDGDERSPGERDLQQPLPSLSLSEQQRAHGLAFSFPHHSPTSPVCWRASSSVGAGGAVWGSFMGRLRTPTSLHPHREGQSIRSLLLAPGPFTSPNVSISIQWLISINY